ncbi:hypothetical protein BC938DRAFT_475051 [Jimgerdemannia flammicorona]|uniref:Yeast cell wall synthesis Kre9/Knh1-like N-terminal domain-containing protein n=1 Tax=Jimgerdemannia flammicorona TaxID=994334 RepID=A0A433Q184_9FUNG|nr:hypothetical protein BC938DRAFT_475051 [Jimgerdemannia flammicorona]
MLCKVASPLMDQRQTLPGFLTPSPKAIRNHAAQSSRCIHSVRVHRLVPVPHGSCRKHGLDYRSVLVFLFPMPYESTISHALFALLSGETVAISWANSTAGNTARINLMEGPPQALLPVQAIASNLIFTSNSGLLSWRIPADVTPGNDYVVAIALGNGTTVYSHSFTIASSLKPTSSPVSVRKAVVTPTSNITTHLTPINSGASMTFRNSITPTSSGSSSAAPDRKNSMNAFGSIVIVSMLLRVIGEF